MLQFFCLLLLFCVGFSEAAVGLFPQRQQPGKTPYCVDHEEGKKKIGEEWRGICFKKVCYADSNGAAVIEISGCGLVPELENCTIVTPTEAKTWPECCPVLQCGTTDMKQEWR